MTTEAVLERAATTLGDRCLTLIGPAGAGKSTVGALLAARLRRPLVDVDALLEAYYSLPLGAILEQLGRDEFLKAEEALAATLNLKACVVATGGSVILGPKAVERLKTLGPLVLLDAKPETLAGRVGDLTERAFVRREGQSFAEALAERDPLYKAAADFVVDADCAGPADCAEAVLLWLGDAGREGEAHG